MDTARIPGKLPELISAATRLPLVAIPLFFAVGSVAGSSGLAWAGVCLVLTSGLSLAYLAYLNRSGKVRDPWRITRPERIKPLRVVAGLHVGAFLVATLLGAPEPLRAVLLSYALATLLFAGLVPFVNLSLHTAGVTGAAVCLTYVFGPWASLAFLSIPLVGWARATLGRHTSLELALGTLVGATGTWIAFQLIG
ncbi:MAG: hypothetical protein ACR2GU_15125 [Rubrobacteraceae bacterium]